MQMNSYVFEKMAKHHQIELEKKSRTAWMWNESNHRQGLVRQLIESFTRKKAVVSDAVNEVCCRCCAVTP